VDLVTLEHVAQFLQHASISLPNPVGVPHSHMPHKNAQVGKCVSLEQRELPCRGSDWEGLEVLGDAHTQHLCDMRSFPLLEFALWMV